MTQLLPNNTDITWTLPARREKAFTLRISRNLLLTFSLSILLHLSLLWIFAPKLFSLGAPVVDAPPLEITLGPPQKEKVAPSEEVLPSSEVIKERQSDQPKPETKRKPIKARPPRQIKPIETPVDIVKESEMQVQKNEDLNKVMPKPRQPEASIDPLPGEDMQAYIKRQQQAKLAKQGLAKHDIEEIMASNNPQSEGDKRDAKIKENLNLEGSNGIFEIRARSLRKAQFSFKGWKNNINNARLEIIDVTAPEGVDIRRIIIKKMIEIIRRDYDGDFHWDSRRLGRVLVLSARPKDNEGLESFMMDEFFSSSAPVH
jgi:hypothetical protein